MLNKTAVAIHKLRFISRTCLSLSTLQIGEIRLGLHFLCLDEVGSVTLDADQRYETAAFYSLASNLRGLPTDQLKFLRVRGADWNDHFPSLPELLDQTSWQGRSRCRNQNCVVGGIVRPALAAVSHRDFDVSES
jgi:hypothetical protein